MAGLYALLRQEQYHKYGHTSLDEAWGMRGGQVWFRGAPLGLHELVYTLKVEGQAIGIFVLSAYRDDADSAQECRKAWLQLAKEGGRIPWVEWEAAWESAPVFSASQRESYLKVLRLLSEDLMKRLDHGDTLVGESQALPAIITKACHYIRDHYDRPLTLKEVAHHCEVSPEHLSRLFHQATQLRMHDYLTETRLNEATELLCSTQDSIASIAEGVGFSTLSRFNHNFKAYTGMTPSQWRRRH